MSERKFKYSRVLGIVSSLTQLNQINPISTEIAKAKKKFTKVLEEFNEQNDEIFSEYVMKDENGKWAFTTECTERMQKIKDVNSQLLAVGKTVNYQTSTTDFELHDPSKLEEFTAKIKELNGTEFSITIPGIDCMSRQVVTEDGKKPLIEVLNKWFTSDQQLFLDEIGLLVNFD